MSRKPSIPSLSTLPPALSSVLSPMKENIEIITGVRGAPLTKLSSSATNAEIIAAINAIISKLNASGS